MCIGRFNGGVVNVTVPASPGDSSVSQGCPAPEPAAHCTVLRLHRPPTGCKGSSTRDVCFAFVVPSESSARLIAPLPDDADDRPYDVHCVPGTGQSVACCHLSAPTFQR